MNQGERPRGPARPLRLAGREATNTAPARQAPPLPEPLPPAAAARAWAHATGPAAHGRAVSQLYSVLRDLGIAARGLAAWRADGLTPGSTAPGFAGHVAAGSRLLAQAWQALEGVLAAEGFGPPADPDEPGTALCQAARDAILAWRQPSGTTASRDETVRELITATMLITAAAGDLAGLASRQPALRLQAAAASITSATACLTAAIQTDADAGSGPADGGP